MVGGGLVPSAHRRTPLVPRCLPRTATLLVDVAWRWLLGVVVVVWLRFRRGVWRPATGRRVHGALDQTASVAPPGAELAVCGGG